MSAAQFVGAWTLISSVFERSDGKMIYPVGENCAGQLIYESNGRMNGQVMGLDRPSFTEDSPNRGTDAEIRSAFENYIAYYGAYHVDEAAGTVTHRVEGSLFPNWVGTDLKRNYRFEGNQLTLQTAPLPSGRHTYIGTLVWERVV